MDAVRSVAAIKNKKGARNSAQLLAPKVDMFCERIEFVRAGCD